MLMGAGAGGRTSSRRPGTGLSRVMVPTSKSERSPEAGLHVLKMQAQEYRRKCWRQRAEAAWEECVPWL